MVDERPWDKPRKREPRADKEKSEETVGEWWSRAPFWQKFAPVAVAILLVGWCSVETKKNMDETNANGDERGAQRACQGYVKSQLKSPGTADFSMESALQDGDGPDWSVSGVVDSENSFGGTVRNGYQCEVTSAGDDQWRLRDLQTDGN